MYICPEVNQSNSSFLLYADYAYMHRAHQVTRGPEAEYQFMDK